MSTVTTLAYTPGGINVTEVHVGVTTLIYTPGLGFHVTDVHVGMPGVAGEPGESGASASTFDYVQSSLVTTDTINHNLGRKVLCDVYSIGGVKLSCDVRALNDNQLQVNFAYALAFYAVIF